MRVLPAAALNYTPSGVAAHGRLQARSGSFLGLEAAETHASDQSTSDSLHAYHGREHHRLALSNGLSRRSHRLPPPLILVVLMRVWRGAAGPVCAVY